MRIRSAMMSLGLAASLAGLLMPAARAEVEFSAGIEIHSRSDFYDPLATFGAWVDISPYGRCWRPTVSVNWRPYCNGHWEWTDVGWYWVSEEPWAWACYHYGYWIDDPRYHWCWIPATEWAPSWVVWRDSPEYIGWAPCAPAGVALAPSFFVFVDVHRFREPLRLNSVIVNNTTIIRRTRLVHGIRTETVRIAGADRRVHVNRGPGAEAIERATGARLAPRPITEVVRQTPVPRRVPIKSSPVGRERRRIREEPPQPTGRTQQRDYREQEQAPVTSPDQRQRREQAPVSPPEQNQRRDYRPREQAPIAPPAERSPRRESRPPQRHDNSGQEQPGREAPPTREFQSQPRIDQSVPNRDRATPRAQPAHERPAPEAPRERPLPPTGREIPDRGRFGSDQPVSPPIGPQRPKVEIPHERPVPPNGRETAPEHVPNNLPPDAQVGPHGQPPRGPQGHPQPPGEARGRPEGGPGDGGRGHDKESEP